MLSSSKCFKGLAFKRTSKFSVFLSTAFSNGKAVLFCLMCTLKHVFVRHRNGNMFLLNSKLYNGRVSEHKLEPSQMSYGLWHVRENKLIKLLNKEI